MHQLSNEQHEQIEKRTYRLWEERNEPLGSQSQINFDIASWCRTADQQVTWGWWLQWIRLI